MSRAVTVRSTIVVLVALVAVLLSSAVEAKRETGVVSSPEGFHYLAKFCYDYTLRHRDAKGVVAPDDSEMVLLVELRARDPAKAPKDLQLYVFDDQASSWPQVYGHDEMSCAERISRSRNHTAVNWASEGVFRLRARIHEHERPRFWYIVAANCKGFGEIEYDIHFVNQGDFWNREFGKDEQGLATLHVAYLLVYVLLLAVHCYALNALWHAEANHPILKLLTATILLQAISVACFTLHYCTFVNNGLGVPVVRAAGEVLQISARLAFFLLLILLAQGWAISTDGIPNKGTVLALVGVFILSYLGLLIWDVAARDPASTLYVYDSYGGIAIVTLDVITGFWFAFSIRGSHRDESDTEKRSFYIMLGCCYVLWFFTLPIMVLAAHFLNPWVREKTVTSISLTVSTLAYGSLAMLLWPGRAERYFRITGPDVMDGALHNDDDGL